MNESVRPEYLSLIDLLTKRLFTIPDYQRSYSWSKRQRDDLFEDIRGLAKEDGTSHFMATVVCLRRDKITLGTNVLTQLDIVDGQQRITTLIILFNAIRHALDKEDEGQKRSADELGDLLVKPDGDNLLLLQTNHDSSRFFDAYLREGTAPNPDEAETLADQNLLSAIHECESFVDGWVEEDRTLLDLATLIKNHLMFILHEISEEKTVYTVFEVLNSRGIPVAWLDRLKSILMGLAFTLEEGVTRKRLINDLHKTWRDIYSTIGLRRGLDTEVLRFSATLWLPERPSKPLGEEEAVDALRVLAGESAKSIRKVAKWVLEVTKACHALRSNPRQNTVTRIVQARLLGVALSASDFSDEDTNELLAIWEKVSFRIYGLHDKDARTGVGDYCRLAWDIADGDITVEDVHERIASIGSLYPIEDGIENLRNGFSKSSRSGGGADCYTDWADELRYLLFRYEEHLTKDSGLRVDNNHWELVWVKNAHLSIEHINPQSTAPDDIVHTLGNLMLLPPGLNSQLRDRPPRQKADAYRKTGFYHAGEVADMLANARGWGKKKCELRQKKILEWARVEWGD